MTSPTLTGLEESVSFDENTVNATPQVLDADVTFTDPDDDFDGGSLTVTGLLAEDSVSVLDTGTGAGQIGFDGAAVTYGGVAIGTLSGGDGTDLTISFNADATSEAIDALIQSLTYANSSDTPTASRDLVINVTDETGASLLADIPTSFAFLAGTDNLLTGIDVGDYSTPSFVDLDGDGDLDLVVGATDGTLHVWDNNNADTRFTQLTGTDNPLDGIDVGDYSTPSFVDLDGDGDLDMVVGAFDGTLRVWDNNDADTGFTELTGAANPLGGIDVGSYSSPSFVDLDGDGDLDLVAGADNGRLRVWDNNDGNAGFTELTGADNPFDSIDVGNFSAPSFVDLDGDGDLDLVVGAFDGTLRVWDNNDGDAGFTELTGVANPFNGIDVGSYIIPSFVDLDGDGDLDLVVGNNLGTLLSYENTTPRGQVLTVNVTAENDAPSLTGLDESVTFDENTVNAAPQVLDADVTFTDPNDDFDGGSLTVTGLLAEDSVSVLNTGNGAGQIGFDGSTVTYGGVAIGTLSGGDGSDLIISFNADATAAAIDALIQSLTYANSSDTPTASRDLVINVTDETGASLLADIPTSFAALTGADNPLNGIDVGLYSVPTFVDLDGDGDLDLVVGVNDGTLFVWDNNDGDTGFTQLTGANNPFDGFDVGGFSTPALSIWTATAISTWSSAPKTARCLSGTTTMGTRAIPN